MQNESARAVQKLEVLKFASDNNLIYIGESSALADINIKEVVETLMESICKLDSYRGSRSSSAVLSTVGLE